MVDWINHFSVGVAEGVRGQGIGRLLVAHTLHALAQYDIVGFYLYYVLTNPLSSRFWPKMGFRPLLVTYKTGSGVPKSHKT